MRRGPPFTPQVFPMEAIAASLPLAFELANHSLNDINEVPTATRDPSRPTLGIPRPYVASEGRCRSRRASKF